MGTEQHFAVKNWPKACTQQEELLCLQAIKSGMKSNQTEKTDGQELETC